MNSRKAPHPKLAGKNSNQNTSLEFQNGGILREISKN